MGMKKIEKKATATTAKTSLEDKKKALRAELTALAKKSNIKLGAVTFRKMGVVASSSQTADNSIELSEEFTGANFEGMKNQETKHALAHLIVGKADTSHGKAWKTAVGELGGTAERQHGFSPSAIYSHTMACGCGVKKYISHRRVIKIKAGKGTYYCSKCDGKFTVS